MGGWAGRGAHRAAPSRVKAGPGWCSVWGWGAALWSRTERGALRRGRGEMRRNEGTRMTWASGGAQGAEKGHAAGTESTWAPEPEA